MLLGAATDLADIGAVLAAANVAAAAPDHGAAGRRRRPAVAAVASLFSANGQAYQTLSA